MSQQEIQELEMELYEKTLLLHELKKQADPVEVPDYLFNTLSGSVLLSELFAGHDTLLAIHNMGQGCRYCMVWADGLNGFLPHLESAMSVVMLSRDDPATQQRYANSRQWRFRMASHGGGNYISEQTVHEGGQNTPGVVCYKREGDKIVRTHSAEFGPGDLYCSMWNYLALAGLDSEAFTPQYNYWRRPAKLDDGGANILD